MEEFGENASKMTPDRRREETDRAFAAIMAEERRSCLKKNMRLRSMRLVQTTESGDHAESL